MDAIANSIFINHIATWAWSSDPSPAVTPQFCLQSLPFMSIPCLSRLIAKGLGVAIICLACINKSPVILNLLKSRNIAGLSITSVYAEVIMYSNAAFYNMLMGNPFTAYGETLMMVFQTFIIVGLIWLFRRDKLHSMGIVLGCYFAYLFLVFRVLTTERLYILMLYNPIVQLLSRGSQIIANYRHKQTGAQSITTTGLNLVGSLVRIATTIKEVGWDFHILRAYGVSVTLNFFLLTQLVMYKSNTKRFLISLKKKN